ncbi:hypothetical protein [Paramaledivibacter caminithermalis]|jgi:hypothetical protein|uniref:Uncharacterized protein n=1 Tax=Paramaledivibacter caminithermalis (strain DSM 15212 / CIP 107654 / DViRD3) TaxID=1121301 RepID=A0A1M6QB23_PARC5|nr:hypothetical protein [Paramaledivibacter caminithermalis]SHK17358.1 hypothetical protein SAMN02745912_02504 [Paramaledivibacter caminithermalis DSM 15212]
MSPILKQTVKNKGVSFWKILVMIVVTVIIMNIAIDFFSRYGASYGSIAALISLFLCTIVCGYILYKNLAFYNYRIIEDELMVERVIGKSNHVFFHIKPDDVISLKPYDETDKNDKDIKEHKFVINNDKKNWYSIEFLKEDNVYRLIFEPNEAFLTALKRNFKETQNNKVISS